MPFSSQKQRAFMYAKHPEIAKKWRAEYGPQKDLPKYSEGKKSSYAGMLKESTKGVK